MKTLFVFDDQEALVDIHLNAISFSTYLNDYPKLNEPKVRVINLCDSERYLSQGYYCSLLAEARNHQVLPRVKVINALREDRANPWFESSSDAALETEQTQVICMGDVTDSRYRKLATSLYQNYPSPILLFDVHREAGGRRVQVRRGNLSELTEAQRDFCLTVLEDYSRKSWRKGGANKKYRWQLAMLVNPEEKVPPSDKGALTRFVKAGGKLGIRVHTVTASQISDINQYDGLFLRETTAIDHHTYQLASRAQSHGLVVIDDPDSILRCCNKVFLHDAFNYQNVSSLRTLILSDIDLASVEKLEQSFDYPIILKMPEGSFSKGVFKVSRREELINVAQSLLEESALFLAQEYMFTEYDWRIGVLNGRALYACRYFMARNHWQIYNHGSKRFFSGGFDSLPTFEVPAIVLSTALKAASVVGNGLYGIDIKMSGNHAYVLEVNDNPSLDHDVEDAYLGDELYMQIMSEFLRRLEMRGR
jgi:glutathione synthase/RimK-type ligase-like ATP-grasp enzyme